MKKVIPSILFLILTVSAMAQTKFPKGTFEAGDLEKAKQTAAAEKKPIAFIYTNKNSTCPLCQGAAEAYVDAVKSKVVLVYLDSESTKNWWTKIPKSLYEPLNTGRYIPKVVVTDSTASTVLSSLIYEDYKKDNRKAISSLKAAFKKE